MAIVCPIRNQKGRHPVKINRKDILSFFLLGFVAIFVLNSAEVGAGTDSSPLNIQANVAQVGRIVNVVDIDFGDYDPTDPVANNSAGSVSVRATKGITYKIYISETSFGVRQMDDGGTETLDFELYTNSARTIRWQEDSASAPTYVSGGNAVSTKTIYGKAMQLQDVPAGVFTAALTITMEF